jgi:hypothetical protein
MTLEAVSLALIFFAVAEFGLERIAARTRAVAAVNPPGLPVDRDQRPPVALIAAELLKTVNRSASRL